jgi:hypothetical protein
VFSSRTAIQFGVLLASWCLLALVHAYWLSLNFQPLPYDQAHHFLLATAYQPVLADPAQWLDVLTVAIYYPPLYHCTLAFMMFFIGPGWQMAPLVNLAWLLALMIAIWLIGRQTVGGWPGVAAAIFMALLPISAGLTREILLEVCLASTVAWGAYVVIKSDCLSQRTWVLALGAIFGLGMLAKWSFALYMAPLFIWAWQRGGRRGATRDYKGLGWALLIFLCITLPWYLHTPRTLVKGLLGNIGQRSVQEGDPSVFSFESLFYYPASLINDQVFLPLALLLAAGLVWGLFKARSQIMPLLVWLLGGLAVLVLMRNKDARYLFPLLPAACLLTMGWLSSMRKRFWRAALCSLALFLAGAAFLGSGLGHGPMASDTWLEDGALCLKVCGADNQYSRPPIIDDWQVPRILKAVCRDWKRKDRAPVLGVMASLYFFHKSAFMAWTQATGPPVRVTSCLEPQNWPAQRPEDGLRRDLGKLDYLVIKTGNLGKERAYKEAMRMIESMGQRLGRELAAFSLPDGSAALLWRIFKDQHASQLIGQRR